MIDNTVSVVVTTCNRLGDLQCAIKSLLGQVVLPDEVVVVDDCSDVLITHEIFKGFPQEVACKIIINTSRKGANYSRNKGVANTSSALVLFLDDDDEFFKDKIKIIKSAYLEEQFDVVYHPAKINYIDYGLSYLSSPAKEINLAALICSNCVGATSMVGVRVAVLEGEGLFDESLPALQDWDAWISLAIRHANFRYIDQALTKYAVRISDSSISKSVEKQKQAISLINKKYSNIISALGVQQKNIRNENLKSLLFLKSLLSGNSFSASMYAFQAFLLNWRGKFLVASVASLFGLRVCIALRARLAHNRDVALNEGNDAY